MMKIIGIIGLALIIVGVLSKKRDTQNHVYISGGVLLTIYSIHLGDLIFTILQIVFVIAAAYDHLSCPKRRPSTKRKTVKKGKAKKSSNKKAK